MKRKFNKLLALYLVIASMLSATVATAKAEDYSSGGYALSTANQTVYQSNSTSSAQVGTLYALEGFTILYGVGNNLYIEYSTSSGAKRGYLVEPKIKLSNFHLKNNSLKEYLTNSNTLSDYWQTSTFDICLLFTYLLFLHFWFRNKCCNIPKENCSGNSTCSSFYATCKYTNNSRF